MATYVIGDIQGCFTPLEKLLAKINYNQNKDILWFAGDLVNRGPDSLKTLKFIMSLEDKAISVLGNHDITLLAYATEALDKSSMKSSDTFSDILNNTTRAELNSIINWLKNRALVHYSKEFNTIMVHAGIPCHWSLQETLQHARSVEQQLSTNNPKEFLTKIFQPGPILWQESLSGYDRYRYITNALTRMRFCYADGSLDLSNKGEISSAKPGTLPWFNLENHKLNDLQIVFGHWASLEGKTGKSNIHALDTGCIWKGSLTAMRLEDKKLFQVSCREI